MSKVRNRGKQSKDDELFGPKWHNTFKEAVDDLGFLLSRGYGESSALQLVGNRYSLNVRQRKALGRMSEADTNIEARSKKALQAEQLVNQAVAIDGFNLLILLESALSGAYVFKCRDGNYRDISSVHGSYKRVVKTEEAIHIVGKSLEALQVQKVHWFFDSPVSNSGRLKVLLYEIAEAKNWPWTIDLTFNPDKDLAVSEDIVISSDGWVLDECQGWFNMGAYLFEEYGLEGNLFVG